MHHILVECKPIDLDLLIYSELGINLLLDWAKLNNLTTIDNPIVHTFPVNIIDSNLSPGYSVLQCLKESHVSIHTYPEYDKAHLDLFSCTILSEDINNRFFKEYFCDYKYQFIDRTFTI